MKMLIRVITLAAAFAVATTPIIRAADEAPPPPDTQNNPEGRPARQGRRGGRMGPAQEIKHLTEVLNLTEDQQTKLKAIFKEDAEKRSAIREDSSLSREDRRAKMMDLMKDQQAKIRAILTPEQQQKFDALPRPGRRTRGEKQGDGPSQPPSDN